LLGNLFQPFLHHRGDRAVIGAVEARANVDRGAKVGDRLVEMLAARGQQAAVVEPYALELGIDGGLAGATEPITPTSTP
jgi:hypothetical protein